MTVLAATQRLGDLCDVVAGGTPPRTNLDYFGGDVPWVKIGDMLQGHICTTDECLTEEGLAACRAKVLPPGTLLVSIFATIGRTAVLDIPAATNQAIVGVLPRDRSVIDPTFLRYFLDLHAITLARQSRGVAQNNINASMLKDVPVPLPFPDDPRRSLAEQKRIAAILDKADAIRRRRQEAARLADTLGSSLFLDRYQPFFREADKHRLVPLEECCERITDGVHITPTYVNDGVPFLRITDIKNGSVDWKSVRQIPRVEYEEITRRTRPGRGDVLYSKNGTIGIPIEVTWDHDFAHFVSLARLSPKRDVLDPTFLCTFLGTDLALRQATSHSKTLTVTNLHLVEIRKILIPCPDLAEQRAFVRDAKRVAEACAGSAVAVAEAEALFNALVQRAFRGEL